jgi:tRNA-modifying protein YgfZ
MNRKLYQISGVDREKFLQGLVSNDVGKLKNGLVYAALLTPQGKYLADFFLVPTQDAVLLDIAAELGTATIQRLNMYRLRADVQITESQLSISCGTGPIPAGAYADPRHLALGWRYYGAPLPVDSTDWDALRVAHCVPESGIELVPNESYLLEAGFERLHGVDFRKGCYVGQEVTARMKHKTELRKGLFQVAITGHAPVGTEISADGKSAGTLFTQSGGMAIAYLRLDRVQTEMTAGEAMVAYDGKPELA